MATISTVILKQKVMSESCLGLCLWILASVVIAVALLLLSVFEGKKDELRETILYPEGSITALITDCLITPEERLKNLESKIHTKCNKFDYNQEMIEETKRTISELEVTSGEIQMKYQDMLVQLKSELTRTEAECQNLHNQIERITLKRDKLKRELNDVGSQFKQVTKTQSSITFVRSDYPYDAGTNKSFDLSGIQKTMSFSTNNGRCMPLREGERMREINRKFKNGGVVV